MSEQNIFDWIDTTDTKSRILAVEHLCELYVQDVLNEDQQRSAEAVMMILMDDRSPKVRKKLALLIGELAKVPSIIVNTLARDQIEVSASILRFSPLLKDNLLVDLVAEGEFKTQLLISEREDLSASVSAALIEVAEIEAVFTLLNNPSATIAKVSLSRLCERLGHVGKIRQNLLERDDLPSDVRHKLVEDLGLVFANSSFVGNVMGQKRAGYVAKDACANATVTLIDSSPVADHQAIVSHLCASNRLTPTLLMSALCVGSVDFFAVAIGFLTSNSPDRIKTILNDGHQTLVVNLYKKAGLRKNLAMMFVRTTLLWRETTGQDSLYATDKVVTQLMNEFAHLSNDDPEIAELLMLVDNIRNKKNRELVKDFAFNLTQKAA